MEDQSAQHPPPVTTFPAFKDLPLEVRSKIWVTASDDIPRPEMYRFRISHTATDAQTGQQVSCFTPAPEVSSLTFQHRRLLRACAEASRELCRTTPYHGFHFYWTTSNGNVRRGTLRQFEYAFTSLCLLDLPSRIGVHYPPRGLESLLHVQRLGLEYVQPDLLTLSGRCHLVTSLLPLLEHLRSLKFMGNFGHCQFLESVLFEGVFEEQFGCSGTFSIRRCDCMKSIPSQIDTGPRNLDGLVLDNLRSMASLMKSLIKGLDELDGRTDLTRRLELLTFQSLVWN